MIPLLRCVPLLLALAHPAAAEEAPPEAEAYRKVHAARDRARKYRSGAAVQRFETAARTFLARFPASPHRSNVQLWIGDLLKESRPRAAHAAYLRSTAPVAAGRAADVAFRFEAPPRLDVVGWQGEPIQPEAGGGQVTLLLFFQLNHPQTQRLFSPVEGLARKFAGRGLRVAGVAAVVDDHVHQAPARIREALREKPPFLPVAIDRARKSGPSSSLGRYRGNRVPWAVVFDRYDRIAWFGAASFQGNALSHAEMRLAKLVAQPTYAELVRAARDGERAALDALLAIRARGTIDALLAVLADDCPDGIRAPAEAGVRALWPAEFETGALAELAARWRREAPLFRYSFPDDRMVRRSR